MAKHTKKEQAKNDKAGDSSRLYIALAVFAAMLAVGFGAAGGMIDFSAAQPQKAPAAVMERPPPVERMPVKAKAASKPGADISEVDVRVVDERTRRAQPAEAVADTRRDKNSECATWAAAGECANNPAFMASDCATSCQGMLPEQSEPVSAVGAQGTQEAQQGEQSKPLEQPEELDNLWPAPQLSAEMEHAQAESDARGAQPSGGCADLRPDCTSLARHNLSGCGEAPEMQTACALHVHCMYTACALRVHCVCTACALHGHGVCTAHARQHRVHSMCTACARHVHSMCTACVQRVRGLGTWRVHGMCTTCAWREHVMYMAHARRRRVHRVCAACAQHVHGVVWRVHGVCRQVHGGGARRSLCTIVRGMRTVAA